MDKIKVTSEGINSQLAVFIFKEDDNFIAYSPALDLSGYGKTEDEARESFNLVMKEYFDYGINEGTLYQDLKKHGWNIQHDKCETPLISVLLSQNTDFSDILENKDFKKYNEPLHIPSYA